MADTATMSWWPDAPFCEGDVVTFSGGLSVSS